MRVAFLVIAFPTLSETFILDQITGLIDLGCEVEIFAAQPETASSVHPEVGEYGLLKLRHVPAMPESFLRRPFQAIRLAASRKCGVGQPHLRSLNVFRYGPPAASLRLFFETTAFANRPHFDVIHCHFGPNGVRGLNLRDVGAIAGKKLVTSFYGYDVSEFPRQRRRNPYTKLFARGDLFLALSRDMKQKLIQLGCPPARIVVHPLGVNPALFPPQPEWQPARPVRILTIGRMVPKKGMECALKAVAALGGSNIEYLIIGDGPLRAQLEELARKLGIMNVVRFAGWETRPEVVRALSQADILLAPSVTSESGDQEGTPVVIMEALACGVPVVSTLHAGIPEVVDNGVTGFLVPERQPQALAVALERLVRDPELRASMGARGRAAMRNRHDIRTLNENLLEIYRASQSEPPIRAATVTERSTTVGVDFQGSGNGVRDTSAPNPSRKR
jgi:colanic acid/amylovoran biosynthesis glycosyltransferase